MTRTLAATMSKNAISNNEQLAKMKLSIVKRYFDSQTILRCVNDTQLTTRLRMDTQTLLYRESNLVTCFFLTNPVS